MEDALVAFLGGMVRGLDVSVLLKMNEMESLIKTKTWEEEEKVGAK